MKDDISILSIVDEAMASKHITKSRYDLLARLLLANCDLPTSDPFPEDFEKGLAEARREIRKFGVGSMTDMDLIAAADYLEWKIHDLLIDLESLDRELDRRVGDRWEFRKYRTLL